MRKFYCTVIHIEVLSEDELPETMDLEGIHYAITDGDCSGLVKWDTPLTLSGRQAADALYNHGSDPGFFQLTNAGEDVEDA